MWCSPCQNRALSVADRCYRCHRLSPAGRTCATCRRTSPLYSVRAATRYEGSSKQLVWRLKFDRARAAAWAAAAVMASRLPLPDSALIAAVPATTSHVRHRGYDQAVLLARAFARRTSLPTDLLLIRLNQKQQRGATRQQRLTQLEGAFDVRRPEVVAGRHIVLVDDVITTGATLEAAARALKAAGAKRVSAVVFAQA